MPKIKDEVTDLFGICLVYACVMFIFMLGYVFIFVLQWPAITMLVKQNNNKKP